MRFIKKFESEQIRKKNKKRFISVFHSILEKIRNDSMKMYNLKEI